MSAKNRAQVSRRNQRRTTRSSNVSGTGSGGRSGAKRYKSKPTIKKQPYISGSAPTGSRRKKAKVKAGGQRKRSSRPK